jgi:hypothetical protein
MKDYIKRFEERIENRISEIEAQDEINIKLK